MPLFAGLKPQSLALMCAGCRVLELPAGSSLFASGDPIREAYFLVSGSVKRSARLADQVEKVLELVRPGQMFALSEVFSAKTYASCAETVKTSTVLAIPFDNLVGVAGKVPALTMRLLEMIARQHLTSEFEVVSHHSVTGTQRVLDYLLRLAGERRDIAGETTVQLDASKKLIAARLDMTPETFSRTLRQLSADGVIVVSGRLIHIQNATLGIDRADAGASKPSSLRYPKMDRRSAGVSVTLPALVNLCGRHRVLSQRMAIAWSTIAHGLSPQLAQSRLRKYLDHFERNLALVSGLSLPPGLRDRVDKLAGIWPRYRDLLTACPQDESRAVEVFRESERILGAADRLTAAAATGAGAGEALCVNIAGRNRMLSARLTKLFLFSQWDACAAEAGRLMAASRREFDTNIARLLRNAINSPEASAQLGIDVEHWRHFLGIIDNRNPAVTARSHARAVLAASESLLRHVDTTVKIYERLAEKCAAQAAALPQVA